VTKLVKIRDYFSKLAKRYGKYCCKVDRIHDVASACYVKKQIRSSNMTLKTSFTVCNMERVKIHSYTEVLISP
jgi:hypothetical protein